MARMVFNQVSKYFGEVVAVKDFSLTIEDKESTVMVGPSGCGKSTVLRMLAGLEPVSAGSIAIDGRNVNVRPKDRDVAMVFQNYALYPHMNVYQNLSFGLKLHQTTQPEVARRVHETAQVLQIDHLLDRRPKELLGGSVSV